MALGRTVGELEAQMADSEFLEWMAFDNISPFGEKGSYWRSGLIASTLANINRDPKKSEAFKPEDFIPQTTPKKPKSDAKAIKAGFMAVFGDRVKRKPDEDGIQD